MQSQLNNMLPILTNHNASILHNKFHAVISLDLNLSITRGLVRAFLHGKGACMLPLYTKTNLNSWKLSECISYFKRTEWVQAALLSDLLVVLEEIGDVLWRQGDPAVVEQWHRWFVVRVLSPLCGDRSERKNNAQCNQEQHSQNNTDM